MMYPKDDFAQFAFAVTVLALLLLILLSTPVV